MPVSKSQSLCEDWRLGTFAVATYGSVGRGCACGCCVVLSHALAICRRLKTLYIHIIIQSYNHIIMNIYIYIWAFSNNIGTQM